MTTITTFEAIKDPQAVLDYSIDWTEWLDGDLIAVSTWNITGPDNLLTASMMTNSTTATTVWLSAGTRNRWYDVTNKIVTSGMRVEERTIRVRVCDR